MATRKTANTKQKEQEQETASAAEELTEQGAASPNEGTTSLAAEEQQAEAAEPDYVLAEVVEKFRDRDNGSILMKGAVVAVPPMRYAELEEAGVAKRAEL